MTSHYIAANEEARMDYKALARVHTDDTAFLTHYWDCMRRVGFLEPEKYLLLAVLKDAFLDYTRTRSPDDRRFKKARTWFFHERSNRLFSFEGICEVLNLNPSFIRRQLAALRRDKNAPRPELAYSAPGSTRSIIVTRRKIVSKSLSIVRANP